MAALLQALKSWPIPPDDFDRLRATPEWEEAARWGWIMESGELTGTGIRHAGEIPTGILPPHQ